MSNRKLSWRNYVPAAVIFGGLGAVIAYFVRSKLNEGVSFGFANMPEEFLKLMLWMSVGAGAVAAVGVLVEYLWEHG